MKKRNQRGSLKVTNSAVKTSNDKIIKVLYDLIIKKEEEKTPLDSLFQQQETLSIIKMILLKLEKDETDIFILTKYLKQLKNFMSLILQGQKEDFDPTPLLQKISNDLECEEYQKNTFMMKVGDIGKKFYVILTGSVSVVVPKNISIQMNRRQYIEHLKMLYKYDERNLLERTFYNNAGTFPDIKLDDIEDEIKADEKRKEEEQLLSESNEEEEKEEENKKEEIKEEIKEEFTLEKYISEINAENIHIERFNSIEVKIIGYYKVVDLFHGSSFGEVALINDNSQRTASIFVKEHSIFGTLTSNAYRKCLRSIQETNKKKDVEFIFKFKLFSEISFFLFSHNYWNYFTNKQIASGDYLFKQGKERDEIYFLQEGEFKITAYQLTHKKVNLIISQLGNFKLEKIDYFDIGKEIDVPLTYAKKGDILGMGDLLYNNKYFCSALCISKKASFFAININMLQNIFKYYKKVADNWKKLEIDKKVLMIQRLQGIKYTNKNSLSGDFRKEDENIVFWESKDLKERFKRNIISDKRYSKIPSFKTIFKRFDSSLLINKKVEGEKKLNDTFSSNKVELIRKRLPKIASNSIFLTSVNKKEHKPKIRYRNFTLDNYSINNSNENSSKTLKGNIRKKLLKLGINDFEKNVLKTTKEDIITKLIFGKEHKDNAEDNYFLVNPENKTEDNIFINFKNPNYKSPVLSKKSFNFFERSSSGKKSILLKELSGIKKYNDEKRKLVLNLNSEK